MLNAAGARGYRALAELSDRGWRVSYGAGDCQRRSLEQAQVCASWAICCATAEFPNRDKLLLAVKIWAHGCES
jgi:hypothetical protein